MPVAARQALIGIDIGTTAIKVGAFKPTGETLASVSQPTPLTRLGPETGEHDADALWQAVAAALRALLGRLPAGTRPASLGVSSFGESGVLIGASGAPLAPVPAWYDTRTGAIYRDWSRQADPESVRRLTGLRPDPTYGMFKLAWLLQTRSHADARAVSWLSVADWVAFRLTGRAQIAASQAARTLALDLRALDWSEAQLASLRLEPTLLPPIRRAGEPVGPVSTEASAETGLSAGLIVGETGHDQVMAALGAGADASGWIVNSCGTAETLMAFVGREALDEALRSAGLSVGPSALPGGYTLMATVRASGSVVDWSVRTFAGGAQADGGGALGDADYAAAARAAAAVPPGANGVWFVPHLRAAPYATALPSLPNGHFGGIRETSTPGDLLRAVLEGVSLESGRHLELIAAVAGAAAAGEVIAVGGPTRNALWMQIKADVYGVPVTVRRNSEGALWGAAIAGARGAGVPLPGRADLPVARAGAQAGAPAGLSDAPYTEGVRRFLPSAHSGRYRALAHAYAQRVTRLAELYAGAAAELDGAQAEPWQGSG